MSQQLPDQEGGDTEGQQPAGRGRPSKYRPEYAHQAAKLCALGATDGQLADFFQVSVSTINLWKIEHPEFSESIRLEKEKADENVERSLYQRAVGYEHDEADIRVIDKEVVITPIRKYYPPDSTAMVFWLKNRKRDQWRDRTEQEHTGKDGAPLVPESADPMEVAKRVALLLAQGMANKGD